MAVGAALAAARADRGLSVEDVSAATRIRAGLIRSIEADDFTACGGAVYARGHIRSIARVVGVDPDPLIAEFDRDHTDEPVATLVPAAIAAEADAVAHAERRQPNWTAAMAAALVVICVLAAYSLATSVGHGSKRPSAERTHTTEPRTTSPAPVRSSPAAPPPGSVALAPRNAAIALVRVTSSQTWMSVTTFSGKVLFQGLLSSGERKLFRDHRGLRLTIGNAPAVDVVANGRDLGSPKSQGNVAHLTIPRGGDVQYA